MSLETSPKMETEQSLLEPDFDEIAKATLLDIMKLRVNRKVYPGYPHPASRLHLPPRALVYNSSFLPIFPKGPWDLNNHANRKTPSEKPTHEQTEVFRKLGYEIDSLGRPLHPWWRDMIGDRDIGLVTGPGFYYKYGPNFTADPIVISEGHILLIKRADTGDWGMPGGHVNENEDPCNAARRETLEETEIELPKNVNGQIIYQGIVSDIRTTVHAWPETSAYLFVLEKFGLPEPKGMDDADEAAWVPLSVVLQEEKLFGSHKFLFNRALARYLSVK